MNRSKGFSLIEVLVTLLLTTLGILGMVALQSRSIQYTADAAQRNAAAELSAQLVNIMRSNPAEIFQETPPAFPAYSGIKNTSMFLKKREANFSPAPATLASGTCNAPDTPQKQRDCWLKTLESKLPNAANLLKDGFYICQSSAPSNSKTPTCDGKGSVIEIQLAWAAKKGTCPDDRAPDDSTYIYRTRVEL